MKARELRHALLELSDADLEMEVLLRVQNDDGDQMMMCSPNNAMADAGCSETEKFIIDGTDGECDHGKQAAECEQCNSE